MSDRRKELQRAYRETPRPMGVYQIRNCASGRVLVGSSVDVPARLNRHRAQLTLGVHPSRDLQADWRALGEDAFEFTTLDTLPPRDTPDDDPAADLAALEALWRETLTHAEHYA